MPNSSGTDSRVGAPDSAVQTDLTRHRQRTGTASGKQEKMPVSDRMQPIDAGRDSGGGTQKDREITRRTGQQQTARVGVMR